MNQKNSKHFKFFSISNKKFAQKKIIFVEVVCTNLSDSLRKKGGYFFSTILCENSAKCFWYAKK